MTPNDYAAACERARVLLLAPLPCWLCLRAHESGEIDPNELCEKCTAAKVAAALLRALATALRGAWPIGDQAPLTQFEHDDFCITLPPEVAHADA